MSCAHLRDSRRHWSRRAANGYFSTLRRLRAPLICSTSVIGNWQHEAARFTPGLSVLVHHGTARAKEEARFLESADARDLVISSYSLLHRDFATLAKHAWSGIILDEAQNIKNPES